jgi:DNA-binding CsgD family transcriptional regulator
MMWRTNMATDANLQFLEASYAWERPDGPWLKGLVETAVRAWGPVAWACALLYDASDVRRFRCQLVESIDGLAPPGVLLERLTNLPARFVARTYRSLRAGFSRELAVHDAPMFEELEPSGAADVFGFNGSDPDGLGCSILLGTRSGVITPDNAVKAQRIADHLTSAYRCRRRLQGQPALETAEAVLAPDGAVLDARGPARAARARAALRSTTCAIEQHRSGRGQGDPLLGWPPRVAARWTLVDVFSQDGARYIVARENLAWKHGLETLTERERQVVACAGAGFSNKEIAYQLGISHATVRVLLARANARLMVRTREELLALPAVRSLLAGTG